MPCPLPLWPCNKVLKPNFQCIISQIIFGCSRLSFIFAKLLLLDIRCENLFALSIVTALTACLFSKQKCAKMSVFYVKTVKIRWRLGVLPPDPRLWIPLCQILGARAPLSWPTSNAVDYKTFPTMFETQSIPTSIRCNFLNEKKLVNKIWKNTECQYRYLKLVQVTS